MRNPRLLTGRAGFAGVALLLLAVASGGRASEPRPEASEAGAVEGRVEVGPQLLDRRVRFNLYPDLRRNAPPRPELSAKEEFANVVIYLDDEGQTLEALSGPPRTHIMKQQGSTFVPHVLPVQRGATVEFPNTDPVFHNVFSLSRAAAFDLGRYPRNKSHSVRFDETGIVKVFCHIHSDMSGVIPVLPNRFFVVPSNDGRYRIDGIPPGEYEIVAWHERAKRVSGQVRIRAGTATSIDFTIPLTEIKRAD